MSGFNVVQTLAGQTDRPVVRLLNAFEVQCHNAEQIAVGFGVHRFSVKHWQLEDSVGFGREDTQPEVYLFRHLALELEIQQLRVVLWLCDELGLEEAPCAVCPVYGEEWTAGQGAQLALLCGQSVVEGSICPWVRLPEDDITLWLDDIVLRA
ncbi:MAG: hypothetical protein OIF57_19860 [Marinobacterium sp.]|nr:hypothetical protein [Marinobacterium sp.]